MPQKGKQRPRQKQRQQPGRERKMSPRPQFNKPAHRGTGKLEGKVALISGGDSGIGRAIAVSFAKEEAAIAVVYLNEHRDAKETQRLVKAQGAKCILIAGDVGDEDFCLDAVERTVREFRGLDILVNNAAEQHPQESIEKITAKQLEKTFRTNIFSMFYFTKAAMKCLREGSVIINNASVTAYKGNPQLLDYSSTKGAIVSFTRSLSQALAQKKIRVNAVAPGPIWTPLIPATFPGEKLNRSAVTPLSGAPDNLRR